MAAISPPATLSPENQVELATLERMLDLASGFTLAFVRVNHPSLRDRLVGELWAHFPQKNILRLNLRPPLEDGTVVHGVLTQLEGAVSDGHPDAIFVFGLDAMFDPAARDSPALDILNLNRSYLAKRFTCPVVFWVAEFGMRELMYRAPDFWRIRSCTYHFVGESEDARSTLAQLGDGFDWNLGLREKHERSEILQHMLKEAESAAHPDLPLLAATLYQLGRASEFEGTPDGGREYFKRALALYQSFGDRRGEANGMKSLGDVALRQSRYAEAEALYKQALPIFRQTPDRLGEANCVWCLGDVARMQNRYAEAVHLYRQALPIFCEIGDRLGEASSVKSLGDVARMQNRYAEAEDLYRQALPIFREIRARSGEANCLLSVGEVARMQSGYVDAEGLYHQALPIFRQIGDRLGEANCLLGLGEIARMQDHYADAGKLYQEALPIYRQIGDRLGEANCVRRLGEVARVQERCAEAAGLYQQALLIFRDIRSRRGEANCVKSLGDVALQQARHKDAGRLYRHARSL
jgi:tetratricopeptide (TPR) repeat protein